ncbi:hypothetical protein COBT_004167, partial [Conglomerata obtusa]
MYIKFELNTMETIRLNYTNISNLGVKKYENYSKKLKCKTIKDITLKANESQLIDVAINFETYKVFPKNSLFMIQNTKNDLLDITNT